MAVVLFLVSLFLRTVYCQTYPYFSLMGETLANHSFVNISEVGSSSDDGLQCITDLPTCCSGPQGPHRGDWYFPNGTRIPFSGDVWESRGAQTVSLYRSNQDVTEPSGIYRCSIQTLAVHDIVDTPRENVYAGLYVGNSGKAIKSNSMKPYIACTPRKRKTT